MKIREIQALFSLVGVAGLKGYGREALGGYCGDLLSDVMANAKAGDIWLTIQSHQNIIAVAVLKELAAIVLVNGRQPDKDTIKKADEENIPLLISTSSAYQLSGRLFEAGLGKKQDETI